MPTGKKTVAAQQRDIEAGLAEALNRRPDSMKNDALSRLTGAAGVYERLPMLDVIADRLVRLLTSGMRQFTSRTAKISIERYAVMKFGEALGTFPDPGLISVTAARSWDGKVLMAADAEMIFALVEVLMGGRQQPVSTEPQRAFTSIERRLAQRTLNVVAQNLSTAFDPIAKVDFEGERIETNPEFVVICRENTPTVLLTLRIAFERVGGLVSIAIPYSTLESVRKALLKMFVNDKFGRDPVWEQHLNTEVRRTELALTGVLHERMIPLGDVANWKPGMTVMLPVSVGKPSARLMCNSVPLFEGEMGQSNGSLAVRIEEPTDQKKEFFDAIARD